MSSRFFAQMRWFIDGYNVIRRDPDLKSREVESLEAGRKALLALVAGIARGSADHFTVVFDGARAGAAAPGGRVQVVFSRPPASADDVLMRLAGEWGAGAVVVTSDRAVGDRARRARCAVLSAEEFLSGAAAAVGGAAGEDEEREERDREEPDRSKRGNPHRLSKAARAARRALRRLRRA